MDGNNSSQLTSIQFKILLSINFTTLLAVVMLFVSQPPTDPGHVRLHEMVEAQDWLIGKTTKALTELHIEYAKSSFGMDIAKSRPELAERLEAYEARRDEWSSDLDESREKLEAGYQKLLKESESDEDLSSEEDYPWLTDRN